MAIEIGEGVTIALGAIRTNKLRSFLTVLGVIIGITTIMAMVSIIEGLNRSMKSQLAQIGTDVLYIRPFAPGAWFGDFPDSLRRRPWFTVGDAEAIRLHCDAVLAVAPLNFTQAPLRYRLIGQTRDDAAGEAFDKVAKLLGLGFPGGPIIQRTAEHGDPRAIEFPLAQISDGARDFSFSGIKTSVSHYVKRRGPLGDAQVADVAASFQAAVVKMLVRRTVRAALHVGVKRVVLTGGVAANGPLRAALAAEAGEHGIHVHIPPPRLCTDNAAMITAAGAARLAAGERAPLTLNAQPDLSLA